MLTDFFKKHLPLITTVLVIITGLAFIVSAVCICVFGGERPYSLEIVSDYLAYISIPSVLTLVSVIAGLVLFRGDADAYTRPSLVKVTLKRLTARIDLEKCEGDLRGKIYRERLSRRVLTFALIFIVLVASLASVLYITLVAELTKENLNYDVASAMLIILPLVSTVLGCGIVAVYRLSASYADELSLVKLAIADGCTCDEPISEEKPGVQLFYERHEKKIMLSVRVTLLLVSGVFIVLGTLNGGMGDVLGKAIRICTECIGLG